MRTDALNGKNPIGKSLRNRNRKWKVSNKWVFITLGYPQKAGHAAVDRVLWRADFLNVSHPSEHGPTPWDCGLRALSFLTQFVTTANRASGTWQIARVFPKAACIAISRPWIAGTATRPASLAAFGLDTPDIEDAWGAVEGWTLGDWDIARDQRAADEKRRLGQSPKATCWHLGPSRLLVADGAPRLDATGDDAEVEPVGSRREVAPDGLAGAASPHAPSGAKGPDGACTPGGWSGIWATSMHPTAQTGTAGGLESVGGGACQGLLTELVGSRRAQRLSFTDAA